MKEDEACERERKTLIVILIYKLQSISSDGARTPIYLGKKTANTACDMNTKEKKK